jgi:predicted TPR repeat methyltransferase
VVHPSGRYSHAEHYVREVLSGAKLTLLDVVSVVLRLEGGHEVNGLLVSAQRLQPVRVPPTGDYQADGGEGRV